MSTVHLILSFLLVTQWVEHSPLSIFLCILRKMLQQSDQTLYWERKIDILIYWSKENESVSTARGDDRPPEIRKEALDSSHC